MNNADPSKRASASLTPKAHPLVAPATVRSGAECPHPEILFSADRVPTQWRNGGGQSTTIVTHSTPDDAEFDWRLSIAQIKRDGAFSEYQGFDRILMALSPCGLQLIKANRTVDIDQFEMHHFCGEDMVASVNVTRPTLDLNLMTRRRRYAGHLQNLDTSGEMAFASEGQEHLVLIVLRGELRFDDFVLKQHDAVQFPPATSGSTTGSARIAMARITPLAIWS